MNNIITKISFLSTVVCDSLEILFFIFLSLKLIGIINWNWWIICSPVLISSGISILIIIITLFIIIKNKK